MPDRVEGDAEIEQAGEADDDVQAPAEHDVDQDLDAVAVDPLDRALRPEGEQDADREDEQQADEEGRRRCARPTAAGRAARASVYRAAPDEDLEEQATDDQMASSARNSGQRVSRMSRCPRPHG